MRFKLSSNKFLPILGIGVALLLAGQIAIYGQADYEQWRSDQRSRQQQWESDRRSRRQQWESDRRSRRQQEWSDRNSWRQQRWSDWRSRRGQYWSDRRWRRHRARRSGTGGIGRFPAKY